MNSPIDRLAIWRNGVLQNPRFILWAQRVPFLRPIARRRARGLFRLVSGFVNSQVLLACADLGLLDFLAGPAQPAEAIASACGLEQEPARTLLQAAQSLGLIKQQADGNYRLGVHGVSLRSDPGVLALVRHHRAFYRDLEDPVGLLRGDHSPTHLSELWPYARSGSPEDLERQSVSAYTDVMSASQQMISAQVLQVIDFASYSRVLDVGGGDGSFLAALAARYPKLQLSLFELPAVAEIALKRLETAGLGSRVQVFQGNFHQDSLPAGHDAISLVRIIHDHDDLPALHLMQSARQALRPGGTLLLAEPLRATPGAEEMGAAYFGFYLLAMGSGRARSFPELKNLLRTAGFHSITLHKTSIPLICSVVSAS